MNRLEFQASSVNIRIFAEGRVALIIGITFAILLFLGGLHYLLLS